ncbi:ketoacyl-ACP synthase III family protein [Nocardiopsis alborubida]|uniref:3-oxoacyl-ACP synthase n=2 Tax=Nocardiopsis TaxID=2013 RepID=A0A7X6M9F0_9ACTN|nr:ketoacyl-ACP synthase III family protein [Nocardiopsis alborubida]NKY97173.1 3-oxoacyl-ACP synthase [Nocardiopsis alborubida]QOP59277.1 3-oxoacyl-ACP synthase [Nocardiopsis sp.]
MRSPLYVASCALHLPTVVSAAEELAAGHCEQETVTATGATGVAVAHEESAPRMAVRAASLAMERGGREPADISLLLHASVFFQGHEVWAPASYIRHEALGVGGQSIDVSQASNGAMAAIDLAAAYLAADPACGEALVTTGDRCPSPGFDRWRSDPGTVYGDGGTALVLSRTDGFARLRSLVTVSDPGLERIHRGDAPFTSAPFTHRSTVDLEAAKREYIAAEGLSPTVARVNAGQNGAVKHALAEADVELGDISRVVLPHLGLKRLRAGFLRRLDLDPQITTWPWSRGVGHLSAGDPIAGLDHLVGTGALGPGDLCLLVSVGAGFTWSCAVVEMLHSPGWASGSGNGE